MKTSLKKKRGDKEGWYKVSDLVEGLEIAVPSAEDELIWDEIISIKSFGREHVYDIEVAGTHNFVGNDIFAHNTVVLQANKGLTVQGNVSATDVLVPESSFAGTEAALGFASTTEPSAVLTMDGNGTPSISLFKLATYNLGAVQALAANFLGLTARVDSLEERITKLEDGSISMATSSSPFSTTTLLSALNSFGVFIQNGIAQFGTLVADRFVAATDASGTSSAGAGTILQGNTVVEISNTNVATSSKIFVTFTTPVQGSWYLSNKQGGSFRVSLQSPQQSDVAFDYFIVETQGQIATSTPAVGGGSSNPHWFPVTPDPNAPPSGGTGSGSTSGSGGSTTGTSTPPAAGGGSGSASSTPPAPPASGDTNPPTITLNGAAAIQLTVGDTWSELGATASDAVDGNLTSHISESGTVDTATAGLYTLTYSVADAAGNEAHVSRVVTVVAPGGN